MMSPENAEKYNAMIRRINEMPDEQFHRLIKEDKCPFEPEHMIGVPLGQFHCDCCGEMVVAGLPHPRYSQMEDETLRPEGWDLESGLP